jgi:SAM-dependent methyltransferase
MKNTYPLQINYMNPSEILGRAIKACYGGIKDSKIIVYSPEFDPDEQAVSHYFRKLNEMPEIEKDALNHCRGKVLDVGSAAGSHCLELQIRGFEVTGLELSSDACNIMKMRGVKNIINADIYETRNLKFDTLLMLMNGIGLVGTINGFSRFLNHAKKILNPGGQILFDSANLVYLFSEEDTLEFDIDLNAKYYGEMEYVMEFDGMKSESFSWLYIDFDTMCHYAEKAGFKPELISQDQNFQYLARLVILE